MSTFVARHKPDWDELGSLIAKGRRPLKRLTPADLERLEVLYRRATVQLSQVTTRTADQSLIVYLNGLTAGAHSLIYQPPRQTLFEGAVLFVAQGFARAVARTWKSHFVAAAVMLFGIGVGYYASLSDPLCAQALLMPGDSRQPGASAETLLRALRSGREQDAGTKTLFASFLFQHNFKVGLLSMAAGILAGVPAIYLMLYNGMLLGAFIAIHHEADIHTELYAWLLPHGITELTAIALCGGVGLALGIAVICPGSVSRKQALQQVGHDAWRIALGAGLMLIGAAIIESFVRQSHWNTSTRLAFAAMTAVLWVAYFAAGFWYERSSPDRVT